jgi:glutamate-1-semialdehyde 2,1-aminomutase
VTLEESAAAVAHGLQTAADDAEIPVTVNRIGSMMTPFFRHEPGLVRTWEDADAADREAYGRFFHGMLDRGVYPPPAQFEAWFLSVTHSNQDIERTIQAAREALAGTRGN